MKNQATRPSDAMTQMLEMPLLVSSPAQPYSLLPAVLGGGPRYSGLVAAMDGTMLILLVAVFVCTRIGYTVPQSSYAQDTLQDLHFVFGLGILGLFCLRLVVRLADNEPPMPPPLVDWKAGAAKAVRWALYLFLLAMPLAGWLILSASGQPLALYGLQLPALVAPNKELVSTLTGAHQFGAMLGYLLLGLNLVALLYQHRRLRSMPQPSH